MSRIRRSGLSFVTGIGSSLATLALGLLATPLLLRWLGDERFGAYRVALEWIGYLALLDFGLTGSLQAATAKRLGEGNRVAALAGVRRGIRRFAVVAVLQIACVGMLALFAAELIRDVSPETLTELRWGLMVACVLLFWSPFHALKLLLDSAQQSYWLNLALLVQGVGLTIMSLFFGWAGWGLIGQFAAMVIGTTLYTLIVIRVVASRYPELWSTPPDRESTTMIDWSMFTFNIVGRMSVLSDGIILGSILGTQAVVVFYVTQRFFQIVLQQLMGIGNASWAGLAELYHRGELVVFRKRFLQLHRLTLILGVGAFGPIAVLNEPLVRLWVGAARFGGDEITGITFGQVLTMALMSLWTWPLMGTGKAQRTLPPMIVGSVVNLAFSVAGTYAFGVVGPALGTFVGYGFVYLPWYAYLLHQEFGIDRRELLIEIPKALFLFAPVGAALWLLATRLGIDDWTDARWPRFVAYGVLAVGTGFVYLAMALRVLLASEERRALSDRLPVPFKRRGAVVEAGAV